DAVGDNVNLLPAVAEVLLRDDGAGGGNLLIARQGGADVVDAGLVVERLVPRHERRRLPAGAVRRPLTPALLLRGGSGGVRVRGRVGLCDLVVEHGEDGQPVAQRRDAAPDAPAALFFRQAEGERDVDGRRLARLDGEGQRHDEGGFRVALVAERQVERLVA